MSRQYFDDLMCEPPIANISPSVTATSETIMWNVSNFSPIAANEARPGKVWCLKAGGVMSFAATGALTITPRWGLTVAAGLSMGASVVALTTPGATTAHPWFMEFICTCRVVGAPGTNSTVQGTGFFCTGIPSGGSLPATQTFGGIPNTAVDVSIATGICIGWTLTVAGTITTQWVTMQSYN